MNQSAVVPIIDISPLFGDNAEKRLSTANEIGKACAEIGFFIIVGHQVDPKIVNDAWESTHQFFDTSLEYKKTFVKPQKEYPFGYSEMGEEVLSAGKAAEKKGKDGTDTATATAIVSPPDLKEMFSMGPKDPNAGFPERILKCGFIIYTFLLKNNLKNKYIIYLHDKIINSTFLVGKTLTI